MVQEQQVNVNFAKLFYTFLGGLLLATIASNPVLAQTVSDIGENMVNTSTTLPRVVTGIGYLIGIVFAVHGIIKLKEHVESPNQTALRYPLISLAIGGSMFALPIIYEAMDNLIQPGGNPGFQPQGGNLLTAISGAAGAVLGAVPVQAFAAILDNIVDSLERIPGLITGTAYILGLMFGVAGLLKIKEHVEEPNRAALKDGIIRLVVGGMLFAIPTMYAAMESLILGDGAGAVGGIIGGAYIALTSGGLTAEAAGGGCAGNAIGGVIGAVTGGGGFGVGSVVCNLFISTSPFLAFLTAIAYLFGLVVGIWGILKIKDHVENPSNVSIWDPVAKLVVAGGFFALPYVVMTAYTSVAAIIAPHSNQLNGEVRVAGGPAGLDVMIAALINDTFMPVSVIVNWFGVVAGFILVFIGISRLMKSAQEGARGPGGIGTIMTFVTGGALLAFGPMVTSLGTSLFAADGVSSPNEGTLNYTAGMDGDAIARAHSIIDSIVLFVSMVGFISIARGIFIMRGVAEGNSQASSMAGVTHLIGGAMAVNLAPFLNAVQNTLGIFDLGLGISFGGGLGGLLGGLGGLIGGLF